MKSILISCLLFFVALLTNLNTLAQTYPVQAFVQISPPYNSYLPDYADPFTNQMRVILTLTDFAVPSTQVKLRFSIEGSGYSMQSVDLVAFPSITLTPGVPVEISGSDLAPYLSTANLVFSGLNPADYEVSKVLPEGPATICVEVIDVTSALQPIVGNPACGQTWFSLYDPPLLNMPFCGTDLTPLDPQNVLFSWTPLHMASPLSGSTEYIFELFEIRPDGADPNLTVNATLPIYIEITTNTFVNYGIVQPPLQIGLSYVWRVKARDPSNRNLYRNDGYSAVCTFTYGSIAGSLIGDVTLELNSNGTGVRQGLAWWNASDLFDSYTLEVRKTGNPAYEWFPYSSAEGQLKVNSLEASTEYECRVKGLAGGAETDWSNTSNFTTQNQPEYACGTTVLPAISPIIKPLNFLLPGNIVSVGQFEMTVTSAELAGIPGHFNGYGKIRIPFMLMNLNVVFDDIFIDEDMVMRTGRVEAITDGIDEWLGNASTIFIAGIINQPGGFEFGEDSTVTVYFGDQSLTFEFSGTEPLVFQDESGLVYTVYADGTIVVGGNFTWDDDVLAATGNHKITFHAYEDQIYGFDEKSYLQWTAFYPCIQLADGGLYFVPYKSVSSGESDILVAQIHSDTIVSNPTFKYADGTLLSATKINDTTYHISVGNSPVSRVIYAYDNIGGKIGKANLSVYTEKSRNVIVVPVNGAIVPADLENNINTIFAQANARFDITLAENYTNTDYDINDNGLESPDATLMQKYSPEMRALRDAYFEENDQESQTYYLFIVPEFDTELDGYMVRGKGIGFIKSDEIAHTYAHELGHGAFGLQHTFPTLPQGTSDNLMDYTADNGHLSHKQWLEIHEFNPVFSFLDDEEDGGLIIAYTNDYSEIFSLSNNDGSITFLSLAGVPITIKGDISKLFFTTFEDKWMINGAIIEDSYAPVGSLAAFELNGDYYYSKGNINDGVLTGYYCLATESWYKDTLSSTTAYIPIMVLPSYTIAGFRGNAFRTTRTNLDYEIADTNFAGGDVLTTWQLLQYTSPENIRKGVDFPIVLSNPISDNTNFYLESILFSNVAGSQGTQTGSEDQDYTFVLDDIPYLNEVITSNNNLTDVTTTTEKYIGYHALLIYAMAQFIESIDEAKYCFLDLSQETSNNAVNNIAEAYYNQLTLGNELNTDPKIYDYVNMYYAEQDQLQLPPPSYEVALNSVYLPELSGTKYKQTRLKILFEKMRLYNQLIYSYDRDDVLSYDELELIFYESLSHYANRNKAYWDCFLKLLSPTNKKQLIDKFLSYDHKFESDPVFEELFVQIIENITPEQFEVMYPSFLTDDCAIFASIEDELSWEQKDRFINHLAYLVLELQKNQPNYAYENLPTLELYKDGLNPFDTEIENTRTDCDVVFSTDYYGIIGPLVPTYNLWDLVKLEVKDYFDIPSLDGQSLGPGDNLLAPAFWVHYFLEHQDEITNDIVARYFLATIFTVATYGVGTEAAIILVGLGTSYSLYANAENLSPDEREEYIAIANALEIISALPLFAPSNMVRIGVSQFAFINKLYTGGRNIFNISFTCIHQILKLAKLSAPYGIELITNLDILTELIIHARFFNGPKIAFYNSLQKLAVETRLSLYTPTIENAYLTVNGSELLVKIAEDIPGLAKNAEISIGNFGLTPENLVYIENPSIFVGEGEVILPIRDIYLLESGRLSTVSFDVIKTASNQVYLRVVQGAGSALVNSLSQPLKAIHFKLVNSGMQIAEQGNIIKYLAKNGDEIARIENGVFSVSMAKGSIPNPNTYLDADFITNHITRFQQEGAGFIVVKSWTEGGNPIYTTLPSRKFVGLRSEMDDIIAKYKAQGNDWTVLRDELNLGSSTNLAGEEIYYIKINGNDSRFSFDMPNGNEGGAIIGEWIPGGYTKSGTAEAALVGAENIIHNKDINQLLNNFPGMWEKIN